MPHVKKLYRKNKDGKYVFLGHVPDSYPLDENEKFADVKVTKRSIEEGEADGSSK
ncbi:MULTISPECIES: hypothetical protein [unclassified Lactobacillus]|uniref:hypothetical protein n=1 Tax=unclassified Lactobacillus TaxID=2620435 RepID=UPI001314D282|nr:MULTISPECIES: hypothetical protein [unclassified Lactobacillus]